MLFRSELGEHRDRVNATANVGGRPQGAGPFGAEEQAGNVWEWCFDAYAEYPATEQRDPELVNLMTDWQQRCQTPDKTMSDNDQRPPRAVRGGSWVDDAGWLRAAYRLWYGPGVQVSSLGFRVVVRIPEL